MEVTSARFADVFNRVCRENIRTLASSPGIVEPARARLLLVLALGDADQASSSFLAWVGQACVLPGEAERGRDCHLGDVGRVGEGCAAKAVLEPIPCTSEARLRVYIHCLMARGPVVVPPGAIERRLRRARLRRYIATATGDTLRGHVVHAVPGRAAALVEPVACTQETIIQRNHTTPSKEDDRAANLGSLKRTRGGWQWRRSGRSGCRTSTRWSSATPRT